MDEQAEWRRDASVSERRQFHITIGRGIGDGSDLNLQGEIEMAKLAALYGDSATLLSIKAKMLQVMLQSMAGSFLDWDTARMRHVSGGKILEIYDQLDYVAREFKEKIAQVEEIESKSSRKALRSNKNYLKMKKLIKSPSAMTASFRAQIGTLLQEFKYDELQKLIDSGFLQISNDADMGIGSSPAESFFQRVFEVFDKSSLTYPLFDDDISNIVRIGIREGKISPDELAVMRSKQISLPADFLSRLPNFSQASVKEILDIRRSLERPLVRFRAAIIEYSESVKNASWSEDFKFDAELLYNKSVAPAILDIEEAVEENSIRRHIFSNVISKGAATGLFSFVVSNVEAITDVLGKSGGSLAGAGVGAVASIANDYQSQNSKISKNGVYFLYKVKRRLGGL